jgi:MFS family permease
VRAVLALSSYRRLLLAYALNQLAWSVGNLALSLLVYQRTGSALASTAFFLASQLIPAFIAPSAVAKVHQLDARRVLAVLFGLQAVLFVALAAAPAHFALVPVLALVLVAGILSLAASPIMRAVTAHVTVPAGLLREANALSNGMFAISILVGPLLGGGLVLAGGTTVAVLIVGALFAAIALIYLRTSGLSAQMPERDGPRVSVRAALRRVSQDPAVSRMLSIQAVGLVFFAASVPVEVVLAEPALHAGAAGYGALLSAWGSGAVLGSILYGRWRALPGWLLIALGSALMGVGFLLMAVAPTIVLAIVGAVVGGMGNGIESVAERTALQERVDPHWMAMTMSLNDAMFQALPGLGFLLGGFLAVLAGPRLAFLVGGLGAVAVAAAAALALRTVHGTPGTVLAEPAGAELTPETVLSEE